MSTYKVDVLSLLFVRAGKEPSRALERKKYGDPINCVKLQGHVTQTDMDKVEELLDLWADWMRKPPPTALGYPSEASGGLIASWRKDSEDFENENDSETIKKIDAAYNSLGNACKEAIRRHYKLGYQVLRFGKEITFDDAKRVIRHYFILKDLL